MSPVMRILPRREPMRWAEVAWGRVALREVGRGLNLSEGVVFMMGFYKGGEGRVQRVMGGGEG
jgi:hypothetical protein